LARKLAKHKTHFAPPGRVFANVFANISPMLLNAVLFVIGVAIVSRTLLSAIRTFILPRGAQDLIARFTFFVVRKGLFLLIPKSRPFARVDMVMAMYAPIALISLPFVWLTCIAFGFALMFYALGVISYVEAFRMSGSSLLTLGIVPVDSLALSLLAFIEAAIGPLLIALLISYLPTMYAAYSKRESLVTLLETRAGSPPFVANVFERYQRLDRLNELHIIWDSWEMWFGELDESHTSLPALAFFRSPLPERSWITAAGAVLDSASFRQAVIDMPTDAHAALCIRAGYLALRHICDFFKIHYLPNPSPTDPISITRAEFDAVCDRLATNNVPIKADREQAWRDFVGWRVNYDSALLGLCRLIIAPSAPWSSDRAN
jgi:hypothetical protein